MSAEKISQVTALQQQQQANSDKATALRKQAFSLPEGPERDALLAQRDQLRAENKTLQTQINTVAPDNPATSVYEGPDRNSGQHVYVNPVTGQRYVDPTPPDQAQKSNNIPATDKSTNTAAISADNKAAQQGYAGAPEPIADKTANIKVAETSPVKQEGVNTTVESGTDSGVTVGGPIANSAGTVEQKVLDNGADPYVSNGQTTLTETSNQQQFISGSQDASVAQSQRNRVEQTQAENRALLKEQEKKAGNPEGNWTAGSVDQTRPQQTIFVARNSIAKDDWRIRLSLAPSAKYLYKIAKTGDILYPLASTDGVIFPYTPQINTAYKANYDPLDLMHSNYRLHFYKNSQVDDIQVTADFTAQDTTEANYLLAVIHFFRSVTKMFYGQDGNNGPKAGTPPPLCYLNGYGQYQFNEHPVLVNSFTYNLPNDVDYIRAGSPTVSPGTNTNSYQSKPGVSSFSDLFSLSKLRAQGSRLKTGSMSAEPNWTNYSNANATYVPTKMQIQLTLIPVVTRNDISKNFSLEKYATGSLLTGRTRSGGGIW